MTGYFTGSADFGPGPMGQTFRLTAAPQLPDGGVVDLFVAKYSPSGVVQWVKDTGAVVGIPSSAEGRRIVVDSSGVCVTGSFYRSAVFGAAEANATTLSAVGNSG